MRYANKCQCVCAPLCMRACLFGYCVWYSLRTCVNVWVGEWVSGTLVLYHRLCFWAFGFRIENGERENKWKAAKKKMLNEITHTVQLWIFCCVYLLVVLVYLFDSVFFFLFILFSCILFFILAIFSDIWILPIQSLTKQAITSHFMWIFIVVCILWGYMQRWQMTEYSNNIVEQKDSERDRANKKQHLLCDFWQSEEKWKAHKTNEHSHFYHTDVNIWSFFFLSFRLHRIVMCSINMLKKYLQYSVSIESILTGFWYPMSEHYKHSQKVIVIVIIMIWKEKKPLDEMNTRTIITLVSDWMEHF